MQFCTLRFVAFLGQDEAFPGRTQARIKRIESASALMGCMQKKGAFKAHF